MTEKKICKKKEILYITFHIHIFILVFIHILFSKIHIIHCYKSIHPEICKYTLNTYRVAIHLVIFTTNGT
jgi:hypothetical protein